MSLDVVMQPIRVYDQSGTCVQVFVGHHHTVYDVSWEKTDEALLTASSDGTAKLWKMGTPNHIQIYQHTCFVYCALFHPTEK